MDIEKLADNLGLDVEDFNELFDLYITTTSSDLEQLKAALNEENVELVHERAHSIKGSSGNLGLDELFELARDIDDKARANSLDGVENLVGVFQEKYEMMVQDFKNA